MNNETHFSENIHKDTKEMPVEKSSSYIPLHQSDEVTENRISIPGGHIGLEHCAPISIDRPEPERKSHNGKNIIQRILAGQYFITFGQVKTIACAIERIRNDQGKVRDEIYYPVPYHLQRRLCIPVRFIAFNACYSPLGPFIFAHKLEVSGFPPDSWNSSIREVLSKAKEGWVSVYPDKNAKKYDCFPVVSPFIEEPDYPGFEDDLQKALNPNIIRHLDHPVIQRILLEREQIADTISLCGEVNK